ncbi:MAG: hypothetical protein HC918_07315 [Oscillatoriales cyanobacterium SM2_1_8]|nr:hypothetical protein [Oscillatoriales cyanobacterium SM2_1_8]
MSRRSRQNPPKPAKPALPTTPTAVPPAVSPTAKDETDPLATALRQREQTIEELRQQVAALRSQHDREQGDAAIRQETIRALQQRLMEKDRALDTAQQETSRLQTQWQQVHTELQSLQSEHTSLQTELQSLQTEHTSLQSELERVHGEREALGNNRSKPKPKCGCWLRRGLGTSSNWPSRPKP